MKRIYFFIPIFFLVACGSDNESNETNEPETESPEIIMTTDVFEGEEMAPEEMETEEEASSEEMEKVCDTDFSAYLYDPGEKITNVRNAPGGEVVLSLNWEIEEEYMLSIDRFDNGWFRLNGDILGIEADFEIPGGQGWVHHSVIAIDTRNYGNQEIPVYETSSTESQTVGTIDMEWGGVRVKQACENMVYVSVPNEDGTVKVEGWIETKWVCGNPLTTCS